MYFHVYPTQVICTSQPINIDWEEYYDYMPIAINLPNEDIARDLWNGYLLGTLT